MKNLIDKKYVISGGNSGIGYAVAELLVQRGATVLILGRNRATLEASKAKLGAQILTFQVDVADYLQLKKFYADVHNQFDTIDGVFVNAGMVALEACDEVSEESFDLQIATNFKGAFFTASLAVPLIAKGGAIVFNASLAAHKPFQDGVIYSATKSAVKSLATAMGLELAGRGVRVNSISPGNVATPIFDRLGLSVEQKQAFFDYFKERVPLQRSGQANEIAEVVVFLLSEQSSYVTATDVLVDGGLILAS